MRLPRQTDFNQPRIPAFWDELNRRSIMKTLRLSLMLIGICSLLITGSPMSAQSTPDQASVQTIDNMSSGTLQQLARARRATAKYRDIAEAEEDGYVNIDVSHFADPKRRLAARVFP